MRCWLLGQVEVYQWLKAEALAGRWRWVCSKDVAQVMGCRVCDARGDLVRLALGGYLDTAQAARLGEWVGRFRLKEKYFKNSTSELKT